MGQMKTGYQSRSEKTDEFLYKALFECLEMTDWKNLTIVGLAAQAQVGRKTFYRHFSDLHQLLETWLSLRSAEYLECCSELAFYDLPVILNEFFGFWQKYRRELEILCQANAPWKPMLEEQAIRIISIRSGRSPSWLAAFSAGGFLALLEKWISQQPELSAKQAAADCASQITGAFAGKGNRPGQ